MTGTYQEMQDDIADDLGTQSAVASLIPSKILSAIRKYQTERLWFLEDTSTFNTTAGIETYALPINMQNSDPTLYLADGDEKVTLLSRSNTYLDMHYPLNSQGRPRVHCVQQGLHRLRPIPDAVYTITRVYFKELTPLANGVDTNAWLTHGEQLIRAEAKAQLFMIDRQPDMAAFCHADAERALNVLLHQSALISRPNRLSTYEAAAMGGGMGGYNISTDQ